MTPAAGASLALDIGLSLAELAAAQARLAAFLAEGGCGPEVMFRAELVVEEAVMNVIRHGAARGATRAWLSAEARAGGVALVLEDDGPEFDPLAARPARAPEQEGGFGLQLIRANAQGARYSRSAGRNVLAFDVLPRGAGNGGRDRD